MPPKKKSRPKPMAIGSFTCRAMDAPDEAGRWLWRLEWYPDGEGGKQRTRGLGRHLATEAESAALAAIADLRDPTSTTTRAAVGTWGVLLKAALAAWEADGASGTLADKTVTNYRYCVDRLIAHCESWPLPTGARALTGQVTTLRSTLLGAGWARSTAAITLIAARKAWSWGEQQELVTPLPWPRVTIATAVKADKYIPTPDDIRRLIARVRIMIDTSTNRTPRYDWPLRVLLTWWATGARIGEVAALTVADVDLGDAPAVQLGRHEGNQKTGARWVPIDDVVAATLIDYLDERRQTETLSPQSSLWPVTPGALRVALWDDYVRPALKAENIPDFTPHAGRAAVVDALYELGADPRLVADLLGHTVATALKYYRRSRTPQRRALALARNAGAALVPETQADVIPLRRPG